MINCENLFQTEYLIGTVVNSGFKIKTSEQVQLSHTTILITLYLLTAPVESSLYQEVAQLLQAKYTLSLSWCCYTSLITFTIDMIWHWSCQYEKYTNMKRRKSLCHSTSVIMQCRSSGTLSVHPIWDPAASHERVCLLSLYFMLFLYWYGE
jgi:hypothetical protein